VFFLHEALEAGLDAAIIHAGKMVPFSRFRKQILKLHQNLLFNRWVGGKDPLKAFIEHFAKQQGKAEKKSVPMAGLGIEERLKNRIIEGIKDGIEADLAEARKKYPPLDIINDLLMDGMKVVGDLFGAGKCSFPLYFSRRR